MKKAILFIGVLFFLLMTMPSYAQKTSKKQKENKTKTERVLKKKSQKMKVLTQKKMEQVNPNIKQLPKAEVVKERVTHSPIDPITGEPRNTSDNNNAVTQITSPRSRYRKIDFTEIPFVIEGATKRNSNVKVIILTTYEKYGQAVEKGKKMTLSSDNAGKWGPIKISSINVDEADSKVTHKITAVRTEDNREKENTASVTVYSNPTEITSVKITEPNNNKKVTSPVTFRGRAIKGHTVEIRVQTSTRNASNFSVLQTTQISRVVKDWTPITVNSQGVWETQLNIGKPKVKNNAVRVGEHDLTILVRDIRKKSDIDVLHLSW